MKNLRKILLGIIFILTLSSVGSIIYQVIGDSNVIEPSDKEDGNGNDIISVKQIKIDISNFIFD